VRITTLTLQTTELTPTGALEMTFDPTRAMPFRAGQGGLVHLRGGGVRPFTFSGDARQPEVRILTTLASCSRFKTALAALRPGDRVRGAGAVSTLPAIAPDQPQVLIAQGIGITPFLSMARTHDRLDAQLLQVGTAHAFDEAAAAMAAAEHHEHREGLHEAITRALRDRPEAQWSLSGRPDFVAAVAARLRTAEVPAARVHKDSFWTMGKTRTSDLTAPSTSATSGGVAAGGAVAAVGSVASIG